MILIVNFTNRSDDVSMKFEFQDHIDQNYDSESLGHQDI